MEKEHVSMTHLAAPHVALICSNYILTSSMIYYCTDAHTATVNLFITKNYDQTKPKYVSQTLKEHGSKNSAGRCSCKLTLSLPEVINM